MQLLPTDLLTPDRKKAIFADNIQPAFAFSHVLEVLRRYTSEPFGLQKNTS